MCVFNKSSGGRKGSSLTCVCRLKKRREFLEVSRSPYSFSLPRVVVLVGKRSSPVEVGEGFTASRKVGKAVVRNRAKRRLRALAREILTGGGRPGFNYVFIAKGRTVTCAFEDLRKDLERALAVVHAQMDRYGASRN